MRHILKYLLCWLIAASCSAATLAPDASSWYSIKNDKDVSLHVELFLTTTCSHCQKADAFFKQIEPQNPWLEVNRYVVNNDKAALKYFYKRLQQLDPQSAFQFTVPTIIFCNSRWAGFGDVKTSGNPLLKAMQYCREQIIKQGELSQATMQLLQAKSTASPFQLSEKMYASPFYFIPISGLTDAMSACSLFSLLAFLSFIWLSPDNKKQQLAFGMTYIASLVLVGLVQQVYTTTYYHLLSWMRWPAFGFGLILLGYLIRHLYKSRHGEGSQFSVIIYLIIILTAIFVQAYQQVCGLNVGFIFEKWLESQSVTTLQTIIYHLAYLFFYSAPLSLFLVVYVMISHRGRIGRMRTGLSKAGWIILIIIACMLVVDPTLFASLLSAFYLLIVTLVAGWVMSYLKRRYQS